MKTLATPGVVPAAADIARIAPARVWIARTGAPAWVVTDDRCIESVNAGARRLFALQGATGQACTRVFRCLLPDGSDYCERLCPLATDAERPPRPVRVEVCAGGRRRRATLVPIVVEPPPGGRRRLIHCALVEPVRDRIERWVERLAARSTSPARPHALSSLTPREREILRRLALDETPQEIAWNLGVSYATVRNHIQHILARLDVHSILEAVARYLIEAEPEDEADGTS